MITGVILAGGPNLGMGGRNKALLPFAGETLVERQVREMNRICGEVIVVTNDPRELLPVLGNSTRVITDFYQGNGPLSGMHAAISLAKYTDLWVVGCDMPFLSSEAAKVLIDVRRETDSDAVVPYVNGAFFMLHGVYHKRCAKQVAALLKVGKARMTDLLKRIRWEIVRDPVFKAKGIDPEFVRYLNNRDDYVQALKRAEGSAVALSE